ncbi:MAG: hypothetical protein GY757_05310, partial [bacterium]|nr:hypothetical protein [bacterium]
EKKKKELESKIEAISKRELKRAQKYKEKYEKDNWNATVLDLGYGRIHNYTGDSLSKLVLKNRGFGFWLNGCYGFNTKRFLVSGLIKYIKMDEEEQYFGGLNLRYGSAKANFFVEGVFESLEIEDKVTIAYGGEYKINPTMMLEFGIRTEYDKDFKFANLKPVVKLNWLMKKD